MTDRPSLQLSRLIINGCGRTVYDETFHTGVNIIRGENSSGKSTISDMIFYVLGGEDVKWTDEAASCDWVQAEFIVSGMTLSLRREIKSESPSIAICEGPLSETMKSLSNWSIYGRQRSNNKESFSQFMFEHLGFPQTKSDNSQTNITMHQILRLIYADQNTDCTSIFRRERQPFADRQDIRRSVGEMLLGIDDLRGHELRQECVQISNLLSQKKARLDSLMEAAVKTDPNFSLAQYTDMIGNTQKQQQEIEHAIEEASVRTAQVNTLRKEERIRIQQLEKRLVNINTSIDTIQKTIQSLSINLADSEVFIESLETDIKGLMAANKSRDLIGNVKLVYCPICLATLSESNIDQCPLCKASYTGDAITGGRLRYEQEIKHQINESKQIYDKRRQLLIKYRDELKAKIRNRDQVIGELRSFVAPTAHLDARITQLLKEHGYLTRLIEDLSRLEALKIEVNSLEEEVIVIQKKLNSIEWELERRHTKQEARRNYCQKRIGDLTINILHKDIVDNQHNTLNDATGLVFSFEKDFLSVRHGRLSASTQAFLKNSFYLGLLQFAVEDEQCRLPRFFILDNIEDKGMVPERFRKFHHLLTQYSESVSIPHQVILTTSYIDEELDNSKYCVGPSYDRPPFTLDLKGIWQSPQNRVPQVDDAGTTDELTASDDGIGSTPGDKESTA